MSTSATAANAAATAASVESTPHRCAHAPTNIYDVGQAGMFALAMVIVAWLLFALRTRR